MSVTQAVIFDVDGTLCDVSSIRHLVEGEKRDFHAFHTASADCPPHQWVIDEVYRQRVAGNLIVVMTGRVERFRALTLRWLAHHEVPVDLLMMRANKDFRPDVVIKRELLNQVRSRGFTVVQAWDDNPAIVELWENEGIPTTVVPGWTGKA